MISEAERVTINRVPFAGMKAPRSTAGISGHGSCRVELMSPIVVAVLPYPMLSHSKPTSNNAETPYKKH
eukprot:3529799-Amphidinium_carterae.1